MKPIQKLITIFKAKSVVNENQTNSEAEGWTVIGGNADSSRINKQNLIDSCKNWVAVAVKKNSDNVAQARLKLLKYDPNGTDEEVFDHPALQILARPNSYMTGMQFIKVSWSHVELTGNFYWKITRAGNTITSLFPLNPKAMTVIWNDERTEVLKYKYQVGAKFFFYDPTEVFHYKDPDISNPLIGKGTLEDIAEWVDVDNYITEFNRRFFINGATFGSAIETETNSPTTLETLRANVRDLYTGVKNSFKVFILPKGSKFVESKMTMKDMDMSEGDNRYRDKILSGFGVPKSVIGITEAGSSRADAEAKNYAYQEFTIKPKLHSFTDYLTEFFLPLCDAKNASKMYFGFSDPTPESKETQLKEDQVGLNNQAFLTVNEVRSSRGLPAVPNGDQVMFASNALPLGSVVEDPNAGDTTDPVTTNAQRPHFIKTNPRVIKRTVEDITETIASKAVNFLKTKTEEVVVAESTDRRKVYEVEHKAFIARASGTEDKLKIAFLHHDKHQAEEVKKNLHRLMKGMTKAVKATELLDVDAGVTAIIDFATPLLGDLWKEQGLYSMGKVNPDGTFSFSAASKRLLQASVSKMAKKYTATTLDLITTQLDDGITAGESIDQLTDRLTNVYGLSEEYRAARVARTETYSVANDATRDAFKQSDVVSSLEWYTAEDELVCEYCGPLDGKQIGLDDNFFEKGDTVDGANGGSFDVSYETIENPPLHANCRCEIRAGEISVKGHNHEDEDVEVLEKLITTLENEEIN